MNSGTTHFLLGARIWFLGFSVLVCMEGTRMFRFGAASMGAESFQLPLFVLFLLSCVIYGLAGILGGGLLGVIATTLRRQRVRSESLQFTAKVCATSFLVAQMLLMAPYLTKRFGQYFRYGVEGTSLASVILLLFFSLVIVFLFTKILSRSRSEEEAVGRFFAFSVALNGSLFWATWFHGKFFRGNPLSLDPVSLLGNGAVLLGAVSLYFALALLLKALSRNGSYVSSFNPVKVQAVLFALFAAGASFLFLRNGDFPSLLPSASESQSFPERPNIILATLDTTRADHLSCYGYEKTTTPNIDRFAREGVIFRNAYSPAPWTVPAHASLFTGLYPLQHGAHWASDSEPGVTVGKLSRHTVTLAESLSGVGYVTVGITGGPACSSHYGLDQGFTEYNDSLLPILDPAVESFALFRLLRDRRSLVGLLSRLHIYNERKGDQITRLAIRWIERNHTRGPFLMFLNYFDPHMPYDPPRAYREPFGGADVVETQERTWGSVPLYDGEVAYLDACLGRFFLRLKKLGVYDEALIVLTSDHGEFFGEHNHMGHMNELYEEVIKVPLIIKYPLSQRKKGIIQRNASLVDVVPTLLFALGLDVPSGIQGGRLERPEGGVIAEVYRHKYPALWYGGGYARALKALYSGPFKYIKNFGGTSELYDVVADPAEQSNLIDVEPDAALALERILDQWIARHQPTDTEREEVSPSDLQRLRALGYVR